MSARVLLTVLAFASPLPLVAGVPLVELTTADGCHRGRVVAKDDQVALLADRDGSMRHVPLGEVTAFKIAEPNFRPYSSVDLRDRMLRLVSKEVDADAVATPHYVVVGRAAPARAVAEALEEVYEGYRWYCSTRSLRVEHPEFPLVAIVFPTRATFDDYCRLDDVAPSGSLRGFYSPGTNRFVCYEEAGASGGRISDDLRDTVVHEAVHQIGFNTGLHVRGGETPVWVCEGLATSLEPAAARRPLRSESRPRDRANPERLQLFLENADDPGHVRPEELVASDDDFETRPLDAYAAAWALTFYMMETKPSAYARYLRKLAERGPLKEYGREQRLEDFRDSLGGDWRMLDAEMTRFHKRIAAGERR